MLTVDITLECNLLFLLFMVKSGSLQIYINPNRINNFIEEYKSFTKDYDEIINANELCDQKELEKLRYNLDKQVFSFLPLITKIANRLQRKLLAQQNRNWDLNMEEGYLAVSYTHLTLPTMCVV